MVGASRKRNAREVRQDRLVDSSNSRRYYNYRTKINFVRPPEIAVRRVSPEAEILGAGPPESVPLCSFVLSTSGGGGGLKSYSLGPGQLVPV